MNEKIEDAYLNSLPAKDIESVLWKEPNLKFITRESVKVCEECSYVIDDCSHDSIKYIRDLTDNELNYKIAGIHVSGNFHILLLANKLVLEDECEFCSPPPIEQEEGSYGGAFRDWDDYNYWKNGWTYN